MDSTVWAKSDNNLRPKAKSYATLKCNASALLCVIRGAAEQTLSTYR